MFYDQQEKVTYTTVTFPSDNKFTWHYFKDDLKKLLLDLLENKTLEKIYVGLAGYLDCEVRDPNYFDFSPIGGNILMIFSDDIALEIAIHSKGMISHRTHNVSALEFHTVTDTPPSDYILSDAYFFDLENEFEYSFESTQIEDIIVYGTDTYCFYMEGFDEEKATLAMYQNLLPGGISFILSNDIEISFIGDNIENFYIYIEKL